MERKHPMKLAMIIAVLCLWFNPAAAVEPSKEALLERLNLAGFDYVYEFPYVSSMRTGTPKIQFTGENKDREYINAQMDTVSVNVVEPLSYSYKTRFGSPKVAYAYKIGEAMVCYRHVSLQKMYGKVIERGSSRFSTCMVIPYNIDEVVAKIEKVSDAEVIAALPEAEVTE